MVIVINNSDKQVGFIFGWAYIRRGAYIWNEVSVSTCGELIHGGGVIFGGGGYIWGGGVIFGGLIFGGLRYMIKAEGEGY